MTKTCSFCDREYEPKPGQHYCTHPECIEGRKELQREKDRNRAKKNYRERVAHKVYKHTITCTVCGEVAEVRREGQKTCGKPACKRAIEIARKRETRKANPRVRLCKACGRDGVGAGHQYCERSECVASREDKFREEQRMKKRKHPEGRQVVVKAVDPSRKYVRTVPFVENHIRIRESLFRKCHCGREYLTDGRYGECPVCRGVYAVERTQFNHIAVAIA